MATRTATAAGSQAPAIYNVNGTVTRRVYFNPGGTALSAGDVVRMVKVPTGAVITDMTIGMSASAQSYTVTIGDGNSATRYFGTQSLVLVQVVQLPVTSTGAFGYEYTAEDTVDITFSTVTSGTAANCDVMMILTYTNNP